MLSCWAWQRFHYFHLCLVLGIHRFRSTPGSFWRDPVFGWKFVEKRVHARQMTGNKTRRPIYLVHAFARIRPNLLLRSTNEVRGTDEWLCEVRGIGNQDGDG